MKAFEIMKTPENFAKGVFDKGYGDYFCGCVVGAIRRKHIKRFEYSAFYDDIVKLATHLKLTFSDEHEAESCLFIWNDVAERTWHDVFQALKDCDI